MKLLILTQKINANDSTLGFFHDWVSEFAERCESVIVVALEVGEYHLPANVKVYSLEKERGISRIKYLYLLWKYSILESDHYTHVFVHMNQIYVVIAGWFWRLIGKKVGLWYVHRQVSISLRIATLFATSIFTATSESFAIKTFKVHIVGHGINTHLFTRPAHLQLQAQAHHGHFTIVTVGRITRIKNIETLIEAAALLRMQGFNFMYEIIGPKVTRDDHIYFDELKDIIRQKDLTHSFLLRDAVPARYVREYYWHSDINVNLAPTGGMDKVILEGIVGGSVPLVANEAFKELFGNHAQELLFTYADGADLAHKIIELYKKDRQPILHFLQKRVEADYTIARVVEKILSTI